MTTTMMLVATDDGCSGILDWPVSTGASAKKKNTCCMCVVKKAAKLNIRFINLANKLDVQLYNILLVNCEDL
jgi:hypothetical protein